MLQFFDNKIFGQERLFQSTSSLIKKTQRLYKITGYILLFYFVNLYLLSMYQM
jgi:hypothetical protein